METTIKEKREIFYAEVSHFFFFLEGRFWVGNEYHLQSLPGGNFSDGECGGELEGRSLMPG